MDHDVTVAFDQPVPMRDGVVLRADVYRPAAAGPWPTLLMRTPYDKGLIEAAPRLDPVAAARRGFIVAIQDVRGKFASEGRWRPFRHEREDGFDSVEWAARLPGSNGRVGMYGDSYFGFTQWAAAGGRPPSLRAIAPAMTWLDPTDGLLARGGATELGFALLWSLREGIGVLGREVEDPVEAERRIAALVDECDAMATGAYRELPIDAAVARHGLGEISVVGGAEDPELVAAASVADEVERAEVPVLLTGGWYDIFAQAILDAHAARVAAGGEARLVVGPWAHVAYGDPLGERSFGARAGRYGGAVGAEGDANELQLAWLGRLLGTEEATPEAAAPVRIFVMGRNEWRDEAEWPLARARVERWNLGADGSISTGLPGGGAAESGFDHDPDGPVPTHGGAVMMAPQFPPGPLEQSRVEARPDVLVFTSEPLREELEVTGRVRAILHVRGSSPTADWVVRLCDVDPEGRSYNLCDGILRLREGADEWPRVEVDLWSTSNVFLPGHRLRVQVAGSCFPRWDRDLDAGRRWISHSAERPSFVELPVIDAPAQAGS